MWQVIILIHNAWQIKNWAPFLTLLSKYFNSLQCTFPNLPLLADLYKPVPLMATLASKFPEYNQSQQQDMLQCSWGKDGLQIYTFPFSSKQFCFRFPFLWAVLKVILGPPVDPIHADADMAGHTCPYFSTCVSSNDSVPRPSPQRHTPHTFSSMFVDLEGHDGFDWFWCIHQLHRWTWLGLKSRFPSLWWQIQMATQDIPFCDLALLNLVSQRVPTSPSLCKLNNCTGYQQFPCCRAEAAITCSGHKKWRPIVLTWTFTFFWIHRSVKISSFILAKWWLFWEDQLSEDVAQDESSADTRGNKLMVPHLPGEGR